ncbi:MAG: 3-hydroxyacyl-CoA dehydrogenase family protein [Oscillospiraceae bacterium]
MKIGILGYGKMGREIFNAFFDQTKKDLQIAVFCRHSADVYTSEIQKKLDKGLRRKKFSDEVYQKKQESFLFTTEMSRLSDCDIIIESIAEQIEEKQKLFHELDKIASENCVFATNTSSLSLNEIFSGISNIQRCIGIHFFYPVKLTGFIEINALDNTSDDVICKAADIADMLKKQSVVFSGDYHMYMNQFISVAVSHGIRLLDEYDVSCEQGAEIFSGLFPMNGLLGLVDGIGIGLMIKSTKNFRLKRIQPLITYIDAWLRKQEENGCPDEPNTFLDYMKKTQAKSECSQETACAMCSSMVSVLLNEVVHAMKEAKDPASVLAAACDAVGLAEPAEALYLKYGYDAIHETLTELYDKTGWDVYAPADKADYDIYLK